jgi:hypothetical protein
MSHTITVKDAPWFSHDSNATADPKIAALLLIYNLAGYGRWWRLVEMLREQRNYRLPVNQCTIAGLAKVWNLDLAEATSFMAWLTSDDVKLILTDGSVYWSDRLDRDMERLDEIRARRRAAGAVGAEKRWHRHNTAIAPLKQSHDTPTTEPQKTRRKWRDDGTAIAKGNDTIVDDSQLLPSGYYLKDSTPEEEAIAVDVPPSSAAAALTAAPPTVGDVLPSLTRINPRAEIPSADEPALAALLAIHGLEAVIASYAVYQRLNPGRRLHWFLIDFAKYRAATKDVTSRSPPPPDPDQVLAEIAREEAEHPELVAEAERKTAELKAKMHPKAPLTSEADDWEATAPGEAGS